jgi:sporulation protein YlmC with PRC-barrel domain
MEQPGQSSSIAARPGTAGRASVRPADDLLGTGVYDRRGDRLGDIETLMIDVATGRIAYAVIAIGGFMGIGARLLAVPWTCLVFDADHGCFTLDITGERLERAPAFDRNHWPDMSDPDWGRHVHEFYDIAPYWERQ